MQGCGKLFRQWVQFVIKEHKQNLMITLFKNKFCPGEGDDILGVNVSPKLHYKRY